MGELVEVAMLGDFYVGDPLLVCVIRATDMLFVLGRFSRHPSIEGILYWLFIPGGWLFQLCLVLGGLCLIAVLLFFEQCLFAGGKNG